MNNQPASSMNSLFMSLYLLSWSRNSLNSVEMEVHCYVHKSPPLDLVMSQVNAVYIFPSVILGSILLLSCHLCLGLPSGIFPSSYPVCFFCPSPVCHMPRLSHPIPYLIIIMFSKRKQVIKSISIGYLFLASEVFKQKARGDLLVQQQQYEISGQNKTRVLPLLSSQNVAKNW